MDEEQQGYALKLLGAASLEGHEGPLTGPVVQRQRMALLARLALSPEGTVSRDELLAVLWPDADPERARHALSNALDTIKRALGEDAVEATAEDDLRLDRELVAVDVLEFENAIATDELERAAAIYGGPLLDGLHLRDAPEFERWVDVERERLTRAYGEVLERLAAQSDAEGRLLDAVEWWRRRAALDPYDSRVALALMEALAAAGNRAEAIRHAGLHANLLREDRGADPDPRVERLVRTLRKRRGKVGADRGAPKTGAASDQPSAPTGQQSRGKHAGRLGRWIVAAIVVVGLVLVTLWLAVIR